MNSTTSSFLTLFLCFLVGLLTSHLAQRKGRHSLGWFLIGLLFGLFGLAVLFFLPPIAVASHKNKPSPSYPPLQLPLNDYYLKEWFFLDQAHQQQGPVSFLLLQSKWTEKSINALTYVWSEGMEDWKRIQELPDFIGFLQEKN